MYIQLDEELKTKRIPIKSVLWRQGDTISPKLFTVALNLFISLNWEKKGIKINGRFLNHLRFADNK